MSRTERDADAVGVAWFGDLDPGEQVLVSLAGGKFGYDQLPADALENMLVLSVGRGPEQVERALAARGADPRKVGVVPISGSEVRYDGAMWTSNRVSPMDFTGISIEFTRGFGHLEPGKGVVLVDSASILMMYADVNRVYRLLDSIASSCRERNMAGVYVVDGEAVTADTMNRLIGLFDRVVEEPTR